MDSLVAEENVNSLFPDSETKRRIEVEQPKLPLAYMTAQVGVPADRDGMAPGVYVASGDAWADETADVRSRGLQMLVVEGGHSHMLCESERSFADAD